VSASSWIESGDKERSMYNPLPTDVRRKGQLLVRALLIAGLAAAAAGCNTVTDTTGGIPESFRERHPISIVEGKKPLVMFIGPGRGGLSAMQRAEVLSFARNWQRDASGGVTIDRPMGGANERAVTDTLKETLSILVAAGVPNSGIGIRPYRANGENTPPVRLSFPLMVAKAGPCGLWPDDLGASYDPKHFENREYYNFGCGTQRNLAAMVDNPADLVQPRGETPAYTAKRTFQVDKWRKGDSPATVYSDTNKGAISDLGK
jgi:pilus assembly protein CpaD